MRDNTYFGEPWNLTVATQMEQTPPPIGVPCLHCAEPIEDGDQGLMVGMAGTDEQRPFHQECFIRSIRGPISHHQRTCPCYGGAEHDPSGLTVREAAREAEAYWRRIGGGSMVAARCWKEMVTDV